VDWLDNSKFLSFLLRFGFVITRIRLHMLSMSALAMVLWYHPRLISKRSPVRFPAGCTRTFLSPLPLSPPRLMSYFDVWLHLPSAKIRIAQNNTTRVNISPKKTTCSSRPVEDDGATTTVYWRERIEATKSSTLGRDISNSNMHFVNKNHSIGVSSLAVTTNENLPDK
jgi:hypothetical protein